MAKQSKIYSYPSGGTSGGTAEAGTSLYILVDSQDWTYENPEWICTISNPMFHEMGYLYHADTVDLNSTADVAINDLYGYVTDGELTLAILDEDEQILSPPEIRLLITPSKIKGLEEDSSIFSFTWFSIVAGGVFTEQGAYQQYRNFASDVIISSNAATTPENIIWNNGSGAVTGTLDPAEVRKATFCLVPTSTTGTAVEGEYQRALTGNYIVYVTYENSGIYSWIRITPTQTDTLHTHTLTKTTASITGTNGTVTASHVKTSGTNGSAASFSTSVDANGVLSFSFTTNNPTTLPVFEDVTAAVAASSSVSVLTDVSVNNQLNVPSYNGEISDNPNQGE